MTDSAMTDNRTDFDTDVIIVGLGPAGGTAALALATYGIRVHAVSMFPWVANSPRAHITNQRAVEVLRDLGVEDEARKYATPWDQMGDTLFTTSLAGEEIVRMQTWGSGDLRYGDYLSGSPATMLDIPQPLMEPVLVKNAAERGAVIGFNTEYLDHTQDEDGVTVRLRDVRSGTVFEQRARFLLGFDGARSKIAEQIGLPFEGELARAGTAYILFNADLSRYVAHRPSILHWIMNSKAGFGEIGMGLLRAVRPWDQWIAGWGFDMAEGKPDVSDDVVVEQIRTLIGDPELDIEIVSRSTWYVNQAWAEHYQSGPGVLRRRRRAPPSAQQRTRIQHLHAGRVQPGVEIAYAVKGYAGPGLLESYSAERVPVGKQIVARANQSRMDYAGLREWFDHDSDDPVAAGLEKLKATPPEGVGPAGAALRGNGGQEHRVQRPGRRTQPALHLRRCDPGPRRRRGDVGTRPAAVPAGHHPPRRENPARVARRCRRPPDLHPRRHRQGQDDPADRPLGGQAWERAADKLDLPYLRTVVVGEPGAIDPYGYWRRVREIDEAGALLVRPDGYIAWRHSAAGLGRRAKRSPSSRTPSPDARPRADRSGPDRPPQYSTRAVPVLVPHVTAADATA